MQGLITASFSCDLTQNGFTPVTGYLTGPHGEQLTEVDGQGNWNHTNVWGNGRLLATYDAHGLHYHIEDPLGTRRAQTDASGNLEATYQSLPFGEDTGQTGSDDPTENHFTGKERDTESGLDYFGARYCASNMGRFMSADPKPTSAHLENPQTWNRYTYTLNNPLGLVDPDGKEPVTVVFRAFIPQAHVGPGLGDNRTFSNQANASSRITITMHIETDPAVNGGHPLIGTPEVQMQDTHTVVGGSISPVNNLAPIITPSQDANGTVNLNVQIDTHSGAMPNGASIRSDVNIGVNQTGTQGTVQGTVSGSPAFETNFTPQGAPTTNLPIQGAASGTVPFVQNLYKTNPVDKTTQIQQAPH